MTCTHSNWIYVVSAFFTAWYSGPTYCKPDRMRPCLIFWSWHFLCDTLVMTFAYDTLIMTPFCDILTFRNFAYDTWHIATKIIMNGVTEKEYCILRLSVSFICTGIYMCYMVTEILFNMYIWQEESTWQDMVRMLMTEYNTVGQRLKININPPQTVPDGNR